MAMSGTARALCIYLPGQTTPGRAAAQSRSEKARRPLDLPSPSWTEVPSELPRLVMCRASPTPSASVFWPSNARAVAMVRSALGLRRPYLATRALWRTEFDDGHRPQL
eukprot:3939126-Pyramimonas_sp.AAC.1